MGTTSPVNIATVPHRSPFRYPGGKTWFVPQIRRWLRAQPEKPAILVEPFAGGGIVGLTAVFEDWVDEIELMELDEDVAWVWLVITSDRALDLAERSTSFEMTKDNVYRALAAVPDTAVDHAFRTILRNRVFYGGIMTPESRMMREGENGKGLSSRWYPETLKRRILDIFELSDRIGFCRVDGATWLSRYQSPHHENFVFFIDPPYTATGKKAGKRLYVHHQIDHEALFEAVSYLRGDFLMTYSNDEPIQQLAKQHDFDTEPVSMKTGRHEAMTELMIGRNLDWAR